MAVLTPRWGGGGESAWALRQVAGALALSADVHVLTPQGEARRGWADGVVTVHQIGAGRDPRAATRRDLLLHLLDAAGGPTAEERRSVHASLDADQQAWDTLAELLDAVHPDLVVLADHREPGAARLAERCCPDVPVVSVPLAMTRSLPADPYFASWWARSGGALVFSEGEASLVRGAAPQLAVHDVGLPLAANPSVQREPLLFVEEELPYVLVLSGVPWRSAEWPTALLSLLPAGLPDHGVVVAATDRLVGFRHGEERQTAGVERGTDLLRLLSWARATVDLRPGPLYGRRSIEALLYGSPVVVPAGSRARQHAESGGGLWFSGAGELLWAVEALFDDGVHGALARRGRHYAEQRYRGTEAFVDRVNRAVAPVVAGVAGAA